MLSDTGVITCPPRCQVTLHSKWSHKCCNMKPPRAKQGPKTLFCPVSSHSEPGSQISNFCPSEGLWEPPYVVSHCQGCLRLQHNPPSHTALGRAHDIHSSLKEFKGLKRLCKPAHRHFFNKPCESEMVFFSLGRVMALASHLACH